MGLAPRGNCSAGLTGKGLAWVTRLSLGDMWVTIPSVPTGLQPLPPLGYWGGIYLLIDWFESSPLKSTCQISWNPATSAVTKIELTLPCQIRSPKMPTKCLKAHDVTLKLRESLHINRKENDTNQSPRQAKGRHRNMDRTILKKRDEMYRNGQLPKEGYSSKVW